MITPQEATHAVADRLRVEGWKRNLPWRQNVPPWPKVAELRCGWHLEGRRCGRTLGFDVYWTPHGGFLYGPAGRKGYRQELVYGLLDYDTPGGRWCRKYWFIGCKRRHTLMLSRDRLLSELIEYDLLDANAKVRRPRQRDHAAVVLIDPNVLLPTSTPWPRVHYIDP